MTVPTRPHWSPGGLTSKESLEATERVHFTTWLHSIYSAASGDPDRLSFFEQNLEVWRQLWRVGEMAEVVVVVADVRNPLIHLPPSFIRYCQQDLKKPIILVLTKVKQRYWMSHHSVLIGVG